MPLDPPRSFRILVVEDDAVISKFTAKVLANRGYQVEVARDGAAAWDFLQNNTYDLMITDNHMPKMTGVELLHKVREAKMTMPIIMATGLVPERAFAEFPLSKPTAMLLKPYTHVEYLALVERVLANHAMPQLQAC